MATALFSITLFSCMPALARLLRATGAAKAVLQYWFIWALLWFISRFRLSFIRIYFFDASSGAYLPLTGAPRMPGAFLISQPCLIATAYFNIRLVRAGSTLCWAIIILEVIGFIKYSDYCTARSFAARRYSRAAAAANAAYYTIPWVSCRIAMPESDWPPTGAWPAPWAKSLFQCALPIMTVLVCFCHTTSKIIDDRASAASVLL